MTVTLPNLGAIVGAEHVRPASPGDAVDGVHPRCVVEPGSPGELAAVLREANAAGLAVAPRGGGTKLGWGSPPERVDLVLSTRRLNVVLEHAWGDMTATVQAGCTVADFQRTLAGHGQRLALDPLWPDRATIGGLLATNDSGALRQRYGSLRDLIIGITVALPDGTLARSGGKVVKNVAGYDLPKLQTGAFGTLGVVVDATFRLYPLPYEARSLRFQAATPSALSRFVTAVRDSTLTPVALQLTAGSGLAPVLDVRFEGIATAIAAQVTKLRSLAAGTAQVEPPAAEIDARNALWEGRVPFAVCKFTCLPADLGWLGEEVGRTASETGLGWRLIGQAVGAGLLRLAGPEAALPAVVGRLRAALARREGSLAVLTAPAAVKAAVDVWGDPGDALPLMRRVKARFDPSRTLNPGRFVGGV